MQTRKRHPGMRHHPRRNSPQATSRGKSRGSTTKPRKHAGTPQEIIQIFSRSIGYINNIVSFIELYLKKGFLYNGKKK